MYENEFFFLEYTITSKVKINDTKWHYVEYRKNDASSTLQVDATSEKRPIKRKQWRKMDYHKYSFLGEVTHVPYDHEINIQDFIWILDGKDKVNFVTGLYDTFKTHNAGFVVVPNYVSPKFSEPLPNSTPKPPPNTRPNIFSPSNTKGT